MAVVRKEEAGLQCSSSHARGSRPWGCGGGVLPVFCSPLISEELRLWEGT